MTPPVFRCSLCGTEHVCTERDDAPITATPEEIAKLRAAWHAAIAKDLSVEENARRELKTSLAYFGAAYRTGTWKLPESIRTSRGKGSPSCAQSEDGRCCTTLPNAGGIYLHCVKCPV